MKYGKSMVLSLIVATIFVFFTLVPQYTEGYAQLPLEIKKFYHDVNFVSSFSTPEERLHLAQLSYSHLLKKPLTKRLKKVQEIINKVKDRIWKVDSGIIPPMMQSRSNTLPAELVRIENVQTTQDSITIRVSVYSIGPEVNLILVSQYEKSLDDNKIPSFEDRSKLVQPEVPRTEIHKWLKIDGRWMLKEAKVVLLE